MGLSQKTRERRSPWIGHNSDDDHLIVFERRWIDPGGYQAELLRMQYGVEWTDSGSLSD